MLCHFFKKSFVGSLFYSQTLDHLDLDSTRYDGKVDSYDQLIDEEWDNDDNVDNPHNWPVYLKAIFSLEIGFLSLSVYIGLAIYTPGIDQIMNDFAISEEVALLPMVLFVIAYGIGPLFLSPITEHYKIGRNPVYIATLFLFAILQIPTALAKNIASLCVLRFLSGIFASPVLATGAASVCDIIAVPYMPVVIGVWAICSLCGPTLGPLIGAVLSTKKDWRFCFWFLLILSGTSFVILSLFLPETYPPKLKFERAKLLRKLTGNEDIRTSDETKTEIGKGFIREYLWRPIELTVVEPVVFLINVYSALIYSVLYLWFEAFPIVYKEVFGFSTIIEGICFLSILAGVIIGSLVYVTFIYFEFTRKLLRNQQIYPEVFLPMAIVGAICLPTGIFIFSWSATPRAHWFGTLVGACLAGLANFVIFQTLLNYLGMSFPRFSASAFASNCLWRSVIAGVAPLFAKPLYRNLAIKGYPVGWGSSVLGFIATAMILIPIVFYWKGPQLRALSRFAS